MTDETDATPTATGATNPTLAFFIAGWEAHQAQLIEALSPLTDEQLALRAAPNLRSIGELARHMVATRAGWFSQALGVGDEAFAAYATWEVPGAPPRTASELVAGLKATRLAMHAALVKYTPADLEMTLSGVRGGRPWSFQRGWIVWHVLEHDLHHGGEIGYSLGMHSLKAPGI